KLSWAETDIAMPTGPLSVTLSNGSSEFTTVLSRCRSGGRMALVCTAGGTSSAVNFSFLPPLLATPQGEAADFDGPLLNLIAVSICVPSPSGCAVLDTPSMSRLRLLADRYHTSWTPPSPVVGTPVRVRVDLRGKALGSIDVASAPEVLQINFRIYNDAGIRAHALHARRHSAASITAALIDEFPISVADVGHILAMEQFTALEIAGAVTQNLATTPLQTAQLLGYLGFSAAATAEALQNYFGTVARDAADLLKQVGYAATEVADALRQTFGVPAGSATSWLKEVGFSSTEIGTAL